MKSAFKDIYKINIDVTSIKNAKGNIAEITTAIKGLNAEQAVYRMSLAKCSKEDIIFALQQNGISDATIKAALDQQTNTLATTANTSAIRTQTLYEDEWLTQQWLAIGLEEADTIATNADTVAKTANFSITNMLKVAWAKLTAVMYANPFLAVAGAIAAVTVGIIALVNWLDKTGERAKEAAMKAKEEFDQTKSEIDELNSSLATTKKRIDELKVKMNRYFIYAINAPYLCRSWYPINA